MLAFEEKERIFFDAVFSFEGQFDADFLMKLLFLNANPNYVISDDVLWSSKLHVAVLSKDCSLASVQSILAEDSSQLNQKNIFQVTPLHRAVYCAKNLDIVIELLNQGANVNAVERSMMSALHIAAYNSNQYQYDLLEILIEFGGNVNCVDYKNQTPLHMLVKNRDVQEQSVFLLLQKGADPNACDKNRDSILKVAIQNRYISLNIIKTLLVFGANPEEHLKYCIQNLPLAKLLIQHIAVKKIETVFKNIEDGLFDLLPDQFVDLTFCTNIDIYLELSAFSDNCINELMAMRKININRSCTLFKFISEQSSNARVRDINKNRSLFEDALLSMKYDKFSYCSDLIDAAFEFHDVLNILSEHGLYAVRSMKSLEHNRIYLNYYAITDLASYVTKKDLINLALAYINENNRRDLTKRKLFTSKSTKRVHDGLSDSMLCMKRLKL